MKTVLDFIRMVERFKYIDDAYYYLIDLGISNSDAFMISRLALAQGGPYAYSNINLNQTIGARV